MYISMQLKPNLGGRRRKGGRKGKRKEEKKNEEEDKGGGVGEVAGMRGRSRRSGSNEREEWEE